MNLRSQIYIYILSECLQDKKAFGFLYGIVTEAGYTFNKPHFFNYIYRLIDAGYLARFPVSDALARGLHKHTEYLYKATPEGVAWLVDRLRKKS